jgi:hypothetical protein
MTIFLQELVIVVQPTNILIQQVFAGICEDDPWSFSRQNHSMIQVFMHDMNVAVIGPVFDNNEGKNLLMAQEMEIGL